MKRYSTIHAIGAAASLLALAGCIAPSAKYAGVESDVRKAEAVKTIHVSSVPSGCIVEMNGEYIGQTPFSLTVDADPNGCWPRYHPNGGMRSLANSFVCTAPNGSSDRRTWENGDHIPEMLFFRPFGQYQVQQPLKLGMNTGS